ncbi:MAG: MarR family winged helix-turn-helix transcriptional regulator [Massiliimalia sp.]|jgi:DNA-binding MarR family transcriptional regulator
MESLHYILMKSQAVFSRQILSQASKIGLTPGQPKVLEFLFQYKEADQKTIAAYCEIERATVGSILLHMEESGLITRRQKDGNRRSLYVSLTDKGRDAAIRLMDIFQKTEEQATHNLSQNEVETLKELLSKIYDNIQSPNKKVQL